MRVRRRGEADRGERNDRNERQSEQRQRRSAFAARSGEPDQIGRSETKDDNGEDDLQHEGNERAGLGQVGPKPEPEQHHAHRRRAADRQRCAEGSHELPPVDRLDIGAEHRNQIVRPHLFLSRAIEAASAFSPRCTFTFTADSDTPHKLAVSATLIPSIFTYSIARRILSGSRARSRCRS